MRYQQQILIYAAAGIIAVAAGLTYAAVNQNYYSATDNPAGQNASSATSIQATQTGVPKEISDLVMGHLAK